MSRDGISRLRGSDFSPYTDAVVAAARRGLGPSFVLSFCTQRAGRSMRRCRERWRRYALGPGWFVGLGVSRGRPLDRDPAAWSSGTMITVSDSERRAASSTATLDDDDRIWLDERLAEYDELLTYLRER